MTQTRLPGGEAALIGLVMLAVVAFEATQAVVRHIDTMAHEGSHALIPSLSGRGGKAHPVRVHPFDVVDSHGG
jgi:hypothetical protein